MEYSVIVTPEPEGGFTITMPSFPEYVGHAQSEAEAEVLAREGIQFELDRLRDSGQAPPVETGLSKIIRVAA